MMEAGRFSAGNCREERFWKSRTDAPFIRPGFRTIATGNSTHGRRVDPINRRSIEAEREAREEIIGDATTALATASPAQSSMIRRNPKTNAWSMAARSTDEV